MSTVIVTGSREWADSEAVWDALYRARRESGIDLLVHGGAKGADSIAGWWASWNEVQVQVYPADWERYGKSAGMRRNMEMLKDHPGALVIACPLPGGKGTQAMMALALRMGHSVTLVSPE